MVSTNTSVPSSLLFSEAASQWLEWVVQLPEGSIPTLNAQRLVSWQLEGWPSSSLPRAEVPLSKAPPCSPGAVIGCPPLQCKWHLSPWVCDPVHVHVHVCVNMCQPGWVKCGGEILCIWWQHDDKSKTRVRKLNVRLFVISIMFLVCLRREKMSRNDTAVIQIYFNSFCFSLKQNYKWQRNDSRPVFIFYFRNKREFKVQLNTSCLE